MKCKICNQETCWDDSVGLKNFIVCNPCYYALVNEYEKQAELTTGRMATGYSATLQLIFKMGELNKSKQEAE